MTARRPRTVPVVLVVLVAVVGLVLAPAGRAEPPPGPKPREGTAPAPRVDPERAAREAAEKAAHRRHSERVEARDRADRMRAEFEKTYKAGKVPPAAAADFEKVVAAYRAAIDLQPSGEHATSCRQRLAGAYIYTGDFAAGTRVLEEAVNAAAGAKDRAEACYSLGLHHLQALHKPADALPWLRRAARIVETIDDPQERTKWETAIAEAVGRCEGKR
jgi:tetratricopeptide (TPR) repeat protein